MMLLGVLGCLAITVIHASDSTVPSIASFRVCTEYHFFTSPEKNAFDAQLDCQGIGGDLVTIDSALLDQNIKEFILNRDILRDPVRTGYWIGMNDRNTESTYEWETPSCSSYVNWGEGQPDQNSKPKYGDQDCVQLRKKVGFTWDDEYCDGPRKKGYICQVPAAGCDCPNRRLIVPPGDAMPYAAVNTAPIVPTLIERNLL